MKLFNTLVVLATLVLLGGCAAQARTPWGNLDLKGGSGSDCKPYVAPDAGRRQLPRITPRIVRPVAPVVLPVPNAPVEEGFEEAPVASAPATRPKQICFPLLGCIT